MATNVFCFVGKHYALITKLDLMCDGEYCQYIGFTVTGCASWLPQCRTGSFYYGEYVAFVFYLGSVEELIVNRAL